MLKPRSPQDAVYGSYLYDKSLTHDLHLTRDSARRPSPLS